MSRALGISKGCSGEDFNRVFLEIVGHSGTRLTNVGDLIGIAIRRPLGKFIAVGDAIAITIRQLFTSVQDAVAVAVVGRVGFTFIRQSIDVAVFGSAVGNVFCIIDAIRIAIYGVAKSDRG